MKKRFLAGLMTLCMLLTLLPAALAAETAGGTGWSIRDGVLTVTPALCDEEGVMPEYGYAQAPWSEYSSDITSIVVSSGISGISEIAFVELENVVSVSLPETLLSIGDSAFEGCGFSTITLPASLEDLGSWVFNCGNLKEILVAPGSHNFKSVDGVLLDIDGRELVCYPMGREESHYDIPEGVSEIGTHAFTNAGYLRTVDLTGVKYVRSSAFWGCGGLTVELPDGIQLIDYNAFGDLQNTTITVPASAIYVGEMAFNGPNLTEILVDEDNISYCSVDGVRFTKDGKTLMEYPVAKPDTAYTIPDGTETIADQAFWILYGFGHMQELTVPASVTSMGSFNTWDEKLTKVTFLGDAPADLRAYFFSDVAENFTIYYTPGTSGWTDSENYDAAAGTWCGFPLKAVGSEEGGDGEVVPPEIHKLTAPKDLKWGVYYNDGDGTAVSYPGMIAWTVTDTAYKADYEVYVYKVGEEEPIFRNIWIHRANKNIYKNDHDFVSNMDPEDGQYYFTIQALGDGETTEDSDLVTSGIWTYTYPNQTIEPTSGLFWGTEDGYDTACWTPNPDVNSGGFIVEFWYSAYDASATSLDDLKRVSGFIRYATEPGYEDGMFGVPESFTEKYGDGYYYFTVRTQSGNIENAWHSERTALSPALKVGNPPVAYKMTAIYDDDLCDFTIYNFEGYNEGNYQIIPNGGFLPQVEGQNYGRAVMEITNIAEGYRIKDFLINGVSHALMMIDGAYGGGSTNFKQNSVLEVILEPIPDQLAIIDRVDIYPANSDVAVESVKFSDELFMITADVQFRNEGDYPNYFAACNWEYSLNGTVWLEVPSWGTNRNFNASWSCFTDPEWCDPTIDFMTLENYYLRVRVTGKAGYSESADGESVFYSKPLCVNWTKPMIPQADARESTVTAQATFTELPEELCGKQVSLLAALYDEEGRFIEMQAKTVTVTDNREVQDTLVMEYGSAYEPSCCKVFILDTENEPILDAEEEEVEQDGPLTRGEYCALLADALGIHDYTPAANDPDFSDFSAEDEYYEPVMALVQRGWIVGYADGTFRPNEKLSCAAAAGLLCRAGLCGEKYVDYGGANWVLTVTKAVSNTGMMNMDTYNATAPVYRSDMNFEMVKLFAESMANA